MMAICYSVSAIISKSMKIISSQDFKEQTYTFKDSKKKVYQNKILITDIVFALDLRESAVKYCETNLEAKSNSFYLIVKESNYYQIWKEDSSSKLETKKLVSIDLALEFISLCEQEMLNAVGPIGKLLYKKTVSSSKAKSCNDLVSELSTRITDLKRRKEFETVVDQFVQDKKLSQTSLKEILEARK